MHTGAWQHAWHGVCLIEYSDRDKIKGWISENMGNNLNFYVLFCIFKLRKHGQQNKKRNRKRKGF